MREPSSSEPAAGHTPVLLGPALELLAPRAGETALDGTLGAGGHAAAIAERLAPGGTLVGLDLDPAQLDAARARLAPLASGDDLTLHLRHASFADALDVLDGLGLDGVDVLLADLGFASTQLAEAERGLSFSEDGPLDMRLDTTAETPTAADLVNDLPADQLADVLYRFGEERLSRKIARKIVETRRKAPIQTTGQLAELVRRAYGPAGRKQRIDPATRTFQALRIAVNGELEALDALLAALPRLLRPGGRAAIISFHSLEDRRVKHGFKQLADDGFGRRLTRKPLTAEADEAASNPRSRSAKLRGFERTAG